MTLLLRAWLACHSGAEEYPCIQISDIVSIHPLSHVGLKRDHRQSPIKARVEESLP